MIIDILSWIFLVIGALLGIVGAIGIHRFPDFYSRQHAVGITDTLCAMLILFGLVLIFFFLFVTSPTSSHALVKAAMHSGLKPKLASTNDREKS